MSERVCFQQEEGSDGTSTGPPSSEGRRPVGRLCADGRLHVSHDINVNDDDPLVVIHFDSGKLELFAKSASEMLLASTARDN